MSDLIRTASLMRIGELIEDLGGEPGTVLRACDLDPGLLACTEAFIPYSVLARLMNGAATALGAADFGLRLSRYQDFAMFGPVSVLIRNAGTLAEALDGLLRYLHTYTPAVSARVRTVGETAAFTWEYRVRRMPSTAQLTELTAAVVLNMLARITADEFDPVRLRMTHRQLSSATTLGEYFPCPVEFTADANAIVFPAAALARPIAGDQQAYLLAEQYLGSRLDPDQPGSQVQEVLVKLLPLGEANLASVAAALLVHPRTLQRHLQAEGRGFEEVLAEVRRTRALELISGTRLPMSVIAAELGYSEQSTFARSCARWFGKSPSVLRRGG